MQNQQRRFKQILKIFNPKINDLSIIENKKGWHEYLEREEDFVINPKDLQATISAMLGEVKNKPKGNMLFRFFRRYNFTVKWENKTPARVEEALERFILRTNSLDDIYNQIPIGGKKESIDIGIEEDDSKFIFVELKSWESKEPPLYAILESLKNLELYRVMLRERDEGSQYRDIPEYKDVDLMVLAPLAYYQKYGLIYKGQEQDDRRIGRMQKLLNELSNAFNTKITLMFLQLEEQKFLECCKSVFDKRKPTRPEDLPVICLRKSDAIPELKRDLWKPAIASG